MTGLLMVLDPGKVTGWSEWGYDALTPLRHIDHGMIAGGLPGALKWWRASFAAQHFRTYGGTLIIEDFILQSQDQVPDLEPKEILGAFEVLHPGFIRQPNTDKTNAPDHILKRLGLWWEGAGHDRDTARHAIAYMKRRRHLPTLRWISGRDAGDRIAPVTSIAHARKEGA